VSDHAHLSIGEVLSLLQPDFPEVTISKIRFLESQGLLDPERTPSGYRKFYELDIARLRWILTQQREHFLPLKVIKERLASGELDELLAAVNTDEAETAAPHPSSDAGEPAPVALDDAITPSVASGQARASRSTRLADLQEDPRPVPPAVSADQPEVPGDAPSDGNATSSRPGVLDPGETAVSLTLEELLSATGLSARSLGELERFGLLSGRALGGTTYYDEEALLVAQLAASFLNHGVEARHLRMYKVSAEREAGVFEQLVMPLLKQRNATARAETVTRLNELAELGERMRRAILRQLLRDELGRG
jgi:DNA-binding transcriptional MerR regulator